ncbi:amino acid/polyamine/organocation transporter (APC superfamily) [Scopulibacillus darangshiensis]|uniref:Amino acid/polyamine/organocation transporter (APC superfamily) n=1 Tax=Scopulibacillus darangshiensis TaxID=442528 RepID=A0A4R2P7M1_9BACL|nr:APC family permease [Scopulibacillus darangshiensis]TCP30194.1 amino acid/polyamine/organocation transporter (APC superfamily) [Scopulibacillus darangshiensis]
MGNSNQQFDKVLSRMDVLILAFGAMIGWGWVVLSGTWIASAGFLGAMIAFAVGGVLVVFVGLTYAELVSAMPKAGGEHAYTLRAMGTTASYVTSWFIVLGYFSVVAFEAVALPTVIDYLFPNYQVGYMWTITGWDVYLSWVLVGVIGSIFVTAINYLGVKPAAMVQMVLTIVIVLIGLMLIFGSSIGGESANLSPLFKDGMAGVMSVIIMTPFMFVGFDVIPQASEEMNVPFKSIGKILVISVISAVVFYLAIIYGVGMALDHTSLSRSELATADSMAAVYHSGIFAKVLILGGVAGILTSWNAFIIGGSRVLYAMAESGMLPSWFGKLHPKYKTPSNAILAIGVLATLCPLLGRPMLVWLSDAGGLAIVVSWLMVAISFVVLRKREPDMPRPYRAGKGNMIGWTAIVLALAIALLYMPYMPSSLVWPAEWMILIIWWIIGAFFFIQMKKGKYSSGSGTNLLNQSYSDQTIRD